MAFSNTNLEKLIQMATIEQMYSMLQKLKENVDNFNEYNFEGRGKAVNVNAELVTEIKTLHFEMRNITDNLQQYHNNILNLNIKIQDLEKELYEIKSSTNNNSKFLCQQIRGQQSLTSYPGFSNGTQNEKKVKKVTEEAHIKLKIEEKYLNNTNINANSLCVLKKNASKEEDYYTDGDPCGDESEEDAEGTDELEEKDAEGTEGEGEEEGEEEESEEEVGTEDDELKDLEKEIQHVKQKEEEDAEGTYEEEEEEEEVFEIEIDNIPYFVTDEENGILYEITPDGDIGKKVGIIKNGEPIFN